MPRAKRVNNSSLPKAQIKRGRAKRGIVEPVAQVVEMNTKLKNQIQRPIHEVLADIYEYLEKLPEMAQMEINETMKYNVLKAATRIAILFSIGLLLGYLFPIR